MNVDKKGLIAFSISLIGLFICSSVYTNYEFGIITIEFYYQELNKVIMFLLLFVMSPYSILRFIGCNVEKGVED